MHEYYQFLWKFNWVECDPKKAECNGYRIDGLKIKLESSLLKESDWFFIIGHRQIMKINEYKSKDYSKVITDLNSICWTLDHEHSGKITMKLLKTLKARALELLAKRGFINDMEISNG